MDFLFINDDVKKSAKTTNEDSLSDSESNVFEVNYGSFRKCFNPAKTKGGVF